MTTSLIERKVAVITGASAGIGAAIARDLAAAGARLVLTARRQDRLDALAAEIGGDVATLGADISAPGTADALLALAQQRFGAADILINNAGILRVGLIESFDVASIEAMVAINYTAVVRSSYVFARAMKAAGSGFIVNLSSIGAGIIAPGVGVYGGLKRAVEMFTHRTGRDWRARRLRRAGYYCYRNFQRHEGARSASLGHFCEAAAT
jgi:NADP-dependent 3-hydroxy acid dehydrogenase YdfG